MNEEFKKQLDNPNREYAVAITRKLVAIQTELDKINNKEVNVTSVEKIVNSLNNKLDLIAQDVKKKDKEELQFTLSEEIIKKIKGEKGDSPDADKILNKVLKKIPEPPKVEINEIVDLVISRMPENEQLKIADIKSFLDKELDKLSFKALKDLPNIEKQIEQAFRNSKAWEKRVVSIGSLRMLNDVILDGVKQDGKGNYILGGGGVEQYENLAAFPATGETDILYIAQNTNFSYSWTGSVYVKVGDGADTVWGDITGTLADQTDLQAALDSLKIIVDTRQNIFAQTPENGTKAFATDRGEKFIYINGWQQASTLYKERTGSMDMGAEQDSNSEGYGKDYISQKHLADVTIGGNQETKEGGIRTIFSKTLQKRIAQYYLNGDWRTALTGISIQTDNTESTPDIEFTDFEPYRISLITGNSDLKDINGVPTIQNMKTDMGAFQSPLEINGGIL